MPNWLPWKARCGSPMTTEGACRHLVKDRLDITGARWAWTAPKPSSNSAPLIANSDFDQYWTWHLT